jgi:hypothetical protein
MKQAAVVLVVLSQLLVLFQAPLQAHALCSPTENLLPATLKFPATVGTAGTITAYEEVDNLNLNPYNASSGQHLFSAGSGQLRARYDRLNYRVTLCIPTATGTVASGRYLADYDLLPTSIIPVTDKTCPIPYNDGAASTLADSTAILRITTLGHVQIARHANATFTAGAGRGFFATCCVYRTDS